tara:strand:+ start:107 stop:229 length:123 start_codon:yes stop_codon:yes gene_type:complete
MGKVTKKQVKNASKILTSWGKVLPYYYAAVFIILAIIIFW